MPNSTVRFKALLKLLAYTNKLPQTWFRICVFRQCHQQSFQGFFPWPWGHYEFQFNSYIQLLSELMLAAESFKTMFVCVPSSHCLTQKLRISHNAPSETLHMWFSAVFIWFLPYCDHLIRQADKSRLLMPACQISTKIQQLCFSNIWLGAPLRGRRILSSSLGWPVLQLVPMQPHQTIRIIPGTPPLKPPPWQHSVTC